jgi:hypothetical protein
MKQQIFVYLNFALLIIHDTPAKIKQINVLTGANVQCDI